jgi:hypothetical protein
MQETHQPKIGHYILGKTLGHGGFGKVKCTLVDDSRGCTWVYRHEGGHKNHKQKEDEDEKDEF